MYTRMMIVLASLHVVSAPFTAVAAWEGAYIDQAITRGVAAARQVKDASGLKARSDGLCLIGGFIELNGEITWTCKLKGGKQYVFVGSGDRDVKDLDLQAWEKGKLVAEDTLDDNVPVVVLTAEGDCEVVMKLKLADAPGDGDVHFNVLIMLESGGSGGELSQLEKVAKQLNDVCAAINDDSKLEFDLAPNSICLAAGLIPNEGWKSFARTFAANTTYVIVGAGDDACKDLDIELHHDGEIVCQDDEADATPVVSVEVEEKARCTVKMIMHESTKPSFCVVGILTQKK